MFDRSTKQGDFDPIDVWVDREGGNQAAVNGIKLFLQKVFNGPVTEWPKYVRVHEWTERFEIALPKARWQLGQENRHTLSSTSKQNQKPQAKAKAKSGPNRRPLAAIGDNSPDAKKPKAAEAASAWKSVIQTHNLINSAVGKASSIVQNTETLGSWSWAKQIDDFKELQRQRAELQESLAKNCFFNELGLKTIPQMKRNWEEISVFHEVKESIPAFRQKANDLLSCVATLADMHEARKKKPETTQQARQKLSETTAKQGLPL